VGIKGFRQKVKRNKAFPHSVITVVLCKSQLVCAVPLQWGLIFVLMIQAQFHCGCRPQWASLYKFPWPCVTLLTLSLRLSRLTCLFSLTSTHISITMAVSNRVTHQVRGGDGPVLSSLFPLVLPPEGGGSLAELRALCLFDPGLLDKSGMS
jgi:hypothetical protein